MVANDTTAADARLAVARAMIAAWNAQDWEAVINLFAEDGVLHSMMAPPLVGRAAIAARIRHLGAGISRIVLNIRHIGVIDGVVFIERVDEFVYNGHAGSVPVVGAIEVRDGRVQQWRDYYDRRDLLRAMGIAEDYDATAR